MNPIRIGLAIALAIAPLVISSLEVPKIKWKCEIIKLVYPEACARPPLHVKQVIV